MRKTATKIFKPTISISLLLFVLASCQEPDFEVDQYSSKIVVDGWIEQGKYPEVLLTLSVPYFSDVDSASLRKYVLTTATVTVDNGTTSEILTLVKNSEYFPPYMYKGTKLKGEVGKTYNLKVEYGGRTITSSTTIPALSYLTSAYFKLDSDEDSLGLIYIKFTDDVNRVNYYRTLTQRINIESKYVANYVSNYKDLHFNGSEMELTLYRGNETNLDKQDDIYYRLGDTINLKFCSVDKATYEFWYSFQQEMINTSNPFASSSARVKTNIQNGLGIWCGYGSVYYRIIAK
jgi:hypothetical protein